MSIIWRIIGAVSIILEIIGKKKKRNSRKHNRSIIDLSLFRKYFNKHECTTKELGCILLHLHRK